MPAKGIDAHSAKLNPDKVRMIRALAGTARQRTLAEQFNVSHVAIWKVINHRTWKEVE